MKRISVKIKPKTDETSSKMPEVPTPRRRGRPPNKKAMPQLPSSRVYSVNTSRNYNIYKADIITLKLNLKDVERLEKIITEQNGMLLSGINKPVVPSGIDPTGCNIILAKVNENALEKPETKNSRETEKTDDKLAPKGQFKLMKRSSDLKVTKGKYKPDERKDLIIHSGVKRVNTTALHVSGDQWPTSSPHACFYCCHTFDTTPVGIPHSLHNQQFFCYGNFCSYNCAKKYLCPRRDDDDDMACLQVCNDLYVGDEHGNKLQLLELLFHIETDTPLSESIKPAPSRLVLKMFGGKKTIEEFRESFNTNTTFHTFKMPMVSIGYQIEECTDTRSDNKRQLKNMSLDVAKLEKVWGDLKKQGKKVQKVLTV